MTQSPGETAMVGPSPGGGEDVVAEEVDACRCSRSTASGVRFGGVTALDGLSFTIEHGQICALIGPNGAGKTTLFNVISRLYEPTEGSVALRRDRTCCRCRAHRIAEVGIARTFQNLALVQGLSVVDNVMVGAHARTTGGFVGGLFGLPVASP